MADEIGRVLGGRYRLLSPLGAGASAQVYLADDVRLRRRVAVKILHAGLADDESFLRRFRAEAQAAAALSHPHIVAVYDWSGDEATPYLVTEYLSGGSLRSILDSGHRLSPSQALVVGLEAARALDHAHRQGFVHRDIKPANLHLRGRRPAARRRLRPGPGHRRGRAGPNRPAPCWAPPAMPRPSRPAASRSTGVATSTRSPCSWSRA